MDQKAAVSAYQTWQCELYGQGVHCSGASNKPGAGPIADAKHRLYLIALSNLKSVDSQFRVAPDVQAEMKRTDAEITALAPAILAPAAAPVRIRVGDARVDAIARRYAGKTYVFAVDASRTGAGVTFTSSGFHGSVSVYGESRSVPLSGGTFTDGFAPLAVHVYVIG